MRDKILNILKNTDEHISVDAITDLLTTKFTARNIKYMSSADSTNEEAKRCSHNPDGSLFIAETQSSGKGRLGRSWDSQRGSGIYMSLLLKPRIAPQEIPQITLIAGIAVCRALGRGSLIKWPNDIIIGSKKLCGILTEMSAEADNVNYVICGIGINVNTAQFTDELSDKATSLLIETGEKHSREKIIANIMNEFEPLYTNFIQNGFSSLISEYRSLCVTLCREVRVIYHNNIITGTAIDIDENGGLVVKTDDGIITVTSGEVSVRGLYGYI